MRKLISSGGGSFSVSEALCWVCGGWGGFTLTGGEADAGSDELVRGFEACEP
ncbi:MAG: hypothetical protein KIH01_03480 [Candidatus Freyarchaeota archaeon]|nr:hypothetical protein [Candidatus Jordarchaeia archaeon]